MTAKDIKRQDVIHGEIYCNILYLLFEKITAPSPVSSCVDITLHMPYKFVMFYRFLSELIQTEVHHVRTLKIMQKVR